MKVEILDFQNKQSVAIAQFKTEYRNSFNYVSLGYALLNKLIEITEINESGSVNNILVVNNSYEFVFFMDGDILIGAKQNRVLNTSLLLEPRSKTKIPVSCVEAGRWKYRAPDFRASDYSAPSSMRYEKAKQVYNNLKCDESFYADQKKVWCKVSEMQVDYKFASRTSNLSDVYESKKKEIEEFINYFNKNLREEANGMAIFVRDRLYSLDLFNRDNIFGEYFPKILKGTAMEFMRRKQEDFQLSR